MLIRIIHETCHLYYDSHNENISARDILRLYEKYLNWKEDLPPDIGDAGEDTQTLPHVMTLQYDLPTITSQKFADPLVFNTIPL